MKTWVETDANGRKYITSEPRLHLPPRQWQGLTDDDVNELTKDVIAFKSDVVAFVRKAEAKLKEKNSG